MKNNYSLPKWSQTRNSYSLIQAKHLSLSLSLSLSDVKDMLDDNFFLK